MKSKKARRAASAVVTAGILMVGLVLSGFTTPVYSAEMRSVPVLGDAVTTGSVTATQVAVAAGAGAIAGAVTGGIAGAAGGALIGTPAGAVVGLKVGAAVGGFFGAIGGLVGNLAGQNTGPAESVFFGFPTDDSLFD